MSVEPLAAPDVIARLRAAGCVFAEDEAELILATADGPAQVASMVERRASGLPLEHVLGWAEFHGLKVSVDPGVFVPRRRTEFLVSRALAAADPSRPAVVVDLCCGSGALGAALAAALPGAELHAADIEPAAVRCARRNVAAFGGHVYEGDLFDPLPTALRGRIDILTANVPYVPSGEVGLLPPEAREHEPLVALDGGSDGLDVMRRVALAAPRWLAPGGTLLVETSERQVPGALAAMAAGGLTARLFTSPELYAHVVTGVRTGVSEGSALPPGR
ncbi:putative protein N(5)-glutamine methyltransferase [Streptomyces sp. ASQP_92]|uniref:putative protein N(5)-glutamine methyltransferase n=1 Tax=Streptomyces sp. ASQP_92 TaxID=2979116 RepID=UPI0021BF2AE5|nr:putative protein N(5)-glutamine methyltransferase [Streptomyces sp. ASQP_92]MCT9093022.1 putative protein N(5)-glutamine methyltransferase [Streptomyces sp. ASQP_92]